MRGERASEAGRASTESRTARRGAGGYPGGAVRATMYKEYI